MKTFKKIVVSILCVLLMFIIGMFAYLMIQMYKPVFDASKEIVDVKNYAQRIDDELINRDVKVIGLGEATHGNKEFQELKLDVFKTLIRDNGVSTICFEMDYGEGTLINDYINNQNDMSIEELFSHISFNIYHTEQIKELIEWMREYNNNSRDGKLEFYGFDMQNPNEDLYVVNEFVKQNQILSEFNLTKDFEEYLNGHIDFNDEKMDIVFSNLEIFKEELAADMYDDYQNIHRIRKCVDNIFDAKELSKISSQDLVAYSNFRDTKMKDNVIEIYNQVGYPIMITGHNGHVGYAGSFVKTMGAYLKEELGDDYFVIGTDYFKTTANINTNGKRKNHTSYSGDPLAYQAKYLDTYYLNFENIEKDTSLHSLINNKMSTGSLGEGFNILNKLFAASVRIYAPVNSLYDAMIYVFKPTPLELLGY